MWAGEVTNDAWAPLRAPRLALARAPRGAGAGRARSRFAGRARTGAQSQVQGRWSLTAPVFEAGSSDPRERRRVLAELLLERYGIVTREQVLAEGIKGGFALLYDTFCNLETLGLCRRGYFIEGMGGAQFALPGAVERLRAAAPERPGAGPERIAPDTLVLAAVDPAQPYGAALPWPRREDARGRPSRVAGAYVVMVEQEPAIYVERGGRGLITLPDARGEHGAVTTGLQALARAVRAGRVPKLALERIDGAPAISSPLADALVEMGFAPGPRRLTLTA